MNQMDEYIEEEEEEGQENGPDGTMMDDDTNMNFYAGQQYFDDSAVPRAVHQCDICNKLFISVKGLEQHGVLHTDERPYKCDICEKTFRFKSNMFEHRSVHTGFTPHSCPYCGKTCRLKGNLKKHLKTHVTTEEELEDAWTPFACVNRRTAEVAQNAVIVSGNRDRLTRDSSSVPRPRKRKLTLGMDVSIWTDRLKNGELFPCISVDHKMARLEEIMKSAEGSGMMTSLDELIEQFRPMCFERFDCPLCKSVFMSRGECTEHLDSEHPHARLERPLFCEICLKSFADRTSMDQHESYHKRVELMIEHGEIEIGDPDILLPDMSDSNEEKEDEEEMNDNEEKKDELVKEENMGADW